MTIAIIEAPLKGYFQPGYRGVSANSCDIILGGCNFAQCATQMAVNAPTYAQSTTITNADDVKERHASKKYYADRALHGIR